MKVLFVGDVHVKHNNIASLQVLVESLGKTLESTVVDAIVLAGDILDTHELVNVQLLNRAYGLVETCRKYAKTFILVGNHDYINNQQFLSDCHWMNGLKEWASVVVVDKVVKWNDITLVPYVFPGRFIEALNSDTSIDWKNSTVIFAHQEFKGCKMGAFISVEGDDWPLDYPLVISGHIHERQQHQPNVLYPGSVLTHCFGSSNSSQAYSIFTIDPFSEERIHLDIAEKKTIYMTIGDDINSKDLLETNRFSVAGTIQEITAFKKSNQYKLILENKSKVTFRITKSNQPTKCNKSFINILHKLVSDKKDSNLLEDLQLVTT